MDADGITLGIDLAAQDKNTAACRMTWSQDVGTVDQVFAGDACSDEKLLDLIVAVVRAGGAVGIDAPFGWPDAFLDQLLEYREHGRWRDLPPPDASRSLCYRATDLYLKQGKDPPAGFKGIHPLSVSTDRIGVVAMRCAKLLSRLADLGIPRDPLGRQVVEVYPGGALRRWCLAAAGYKHDAAVRVALRTQPPVHALVRDPADAAKITDTDHAFDAMLSAIVARDVALGRDDLHRPCEDGQLRREGWIRMPMPR
jgi:predicted nuclease with RNAse H fold